MRDTRLRELTLDDVSECLVFCSRVEMGDTRLRELILLNFQFVTIHIAVEMRDTRLRELGQKMMLTCMSATEKTGVLLQKQPVFPISIRPHAERAAVGSLSVIQSLHKPPEPSHRRPQLLERVRIGNAQKALAAVAKRSARHHSQLLLV